LDYYKEHGFGVAQDDVGSGHSTLQLLGVLRPNYVKLEMELVREQGYYFAKPAAQPLSQLDRRQNS